MTKPNEAHKQQAREIVADVLRRKANLDDSIPKRIQVALVDAIASALAERDEQCAAIADQWAQSHSCDSHDDNPCCHIRTGAAIRDAIPVKSLL